jgi:mycothiol synthase
MEPLSAGDEDLDGLLARVATADGRPGLSEHKYVRRRGADDARVGTWGFDGRVAVLAVGAVRAADTGRHWSLEVAVDPPARSAANERDAILFAAAMLPGDARHSVWAWREEQAAAARSLGYREARSLFRMEMNLHGRSLPLDATAVEIGRFDRQRDPAEVIAVNNRAFAGHREAGAMTRADLEERMGRPWYDPEGFLVARREGHLVGFCWTKRHPGAVGEIYIIAVDPAAHGVGLGRTLLDAGLAHLAAGGAETGMLWVDGDNRAAVALYRSMGFATTQVGCELEPT